jgi:hypothetical protein
MTRPRGAIAGAFALSWPPVCQWRSVLADARGYCAIYTLSAATISLDIKPAGLSRTPACPGCRPSSRTTIA